MVWNFYIFIYTAILDTRYWYLVQYSIFPNCPYSEAFWIRIHFRITDLVPAVPVLVKTFIFQTNQQEQGLILSVLSESESTTVFFSTQSCVHRFPALFSPVKI